MKPGLAAAGFVVAALVFLVAAIVHVLRFNAVDAPLVLCAITCMATGTAVHAGTLGEDAPPVL